MDRQEDSDFGQVARGAVFHARRLNGGQPIIDMQWMRAYGAADDELDNINGPSCIRVPDWVARADRAHYNAEYYLYFAHHAGRFIRMAWAANVSGPWHAYHLSKEQKRQPRGVLSLDKHLSIHLDNELEVIRHVASPHVVVDDANKRFIMYFHGNAHWKRRDLGEQRTFVATSMDGLNFNSPATGGQQGHGPSSVVLGGAYFRVFEEAGELYAFSRLGNLWRAPRDPWRWEDGMALSEFLWTAVPSAFVRQYETRGWPGLRPRHVDVLRDGDILYIFFSNISGEPERIHVATLDFQRQPADFSLWEPRFPHQDLLRPQEEWEGAKFPQRPSKDGREIDVHQLRDPGVFADFDGRTYMFYSGRGEAAIGAAQLVMAPTISGPTRVAGAENPTFSVGLDSDVLPFKLWIARSRSIAINYDATSRQPFIRTGEGRFPSRQQEPSASGNIVLQLAHLNKGARDVGKFPYLFYARSGAHLKFESRLADATAGQIAELQASFDDEQSWTTLWIRIGGTKEDGFSEITVDLDGLAGRVFHLRFSYWHDQMRSDHFIQGAGADQGWMIGAVRSSHFEAVTVLDNRDLTAPTFTFDTIRALTSVSQNAGQSSDNSSGSEYHFIMRGSGIHFGESTGFGMPWVFRVAISDQQ